MADDSTQVQGRLPARQSLTSQTEQTDRARDGTRSADPPAQAKAQLEQLEQFDPAYHWGRSY